MAQYLVQVSYTSEACAALINNPQDRLAVVSKAVKKLGGKLITGWMCLGDFDTIVVITLPDNVAAAAFSIALGAGGACKNVKTTSLLSIEEGVEAMKAAGSTGYKAPTA
jgi:uncharacterized protein with GYD domain